ncbi:orotidine-5'-phosphate decarboxylase [Actinomyces ruminicola]|uniref:Orotidine 5'-phosphate decarboxylase n=1 Tax=Actinomyces ruminicola TaxID=332524 RepID=A0A1H0CZT6_9ACTO|nr:orotidine-5'-phosphate decarboxylase [Actinomyces ruminicola]SDN63378.1 orotidine-5'-phosphate decarboxylase [Actinomyces ruminicola]
MSPAPAREDSSHRVDPPFGARLAAAMDTHGPLCVGIDPHAALLDAWGLPDTAAGLREFSLRVVDALGGRVAGVKPQSAFFERHGSAGVAVLEETLAALRQAGTLAILDVKRGDIGSTMDGYAQAYLADGAPLAADAITVSPYLGYGSLLPALELAADTGRGVFVLALTSNPEGAGVQHARGPAGRAVAADIVAGAAASNAAARAAGELGSVGLVVGATVGAAVDALGIDLLAANAPLLAPGVGAQGAGAAELQKVFGPARGNVLASTSRGVLQAGPGAADLREAADRAVAQATAALRP